MRTLLVDDDSVARRLLRKLLAGHPEVDIVGEASTAREAIEMVGRLRPELLFMDIRLHGEDGFSVVSSMEHVPQVVFVSSYNQYAVKAFEVNALDYLVKPVSAERLATTLERLQTRKSQTPQEIKASDLMLLRDARQLHAVAVQKIAAVAADGNFTRLYLVDEPSLFLRRTLSDWETILPPATFLRVDRTHLLNLTLVQSVTTISRDKSVVRLRGVTDTLDLGRTGSARLRGAIQAKRQTA